jgi:hypothetical protein
MTLVQVRIVDFIDQLKLYRLLVENSLGLVCIQDLKRRLVFLLIPRPLKQRRSRSIRAYSCKNHTVPYGTELFGVGFSQALRARLRLHRPFETSQTSFS